MHLADGKPLEAIDQALQLLASAPTGKLPAGAGARAGGSGSLPELGPRTPVGAAAGAGAGFLLPAGEAAAEHGAAARDKVAEQSASPGAAELALESGARAADEGGRSPQGSGNGASGEERGCAEKEAGSAASGSGRGGGRAGETGVADLGEADAEPEGFEDGLMEALAEGLNDDEHSSGEAAGGSKGQAGALPPAQQLQLVPVSAGEAAEEGQKAGPAPPAAIEPKKRGRSGGEVAPKAGGRAKKA